MDNLFDSASELNMLALICHEEAKKRGFWDGGNNDSERIALMHSELSEALEALRHDNPLDEHCPEFRNLDIELADLLIRVFDYCGGKGIDISAAVVAKARFNQTRPYKHGKKF